MLSEDEMKVIERIEDTFYQDNGKGIKRFQKITLYEDGISDILKLLNIFEKLQKEIEHQKEKRENQKVELAILNEKQKEMNKLKNTVSSYYGMFKKQEKQIKELQKENEEKDKEIEFQKDIKQYLKGKVKMEIEVGEYVRTKNGVIDKVQNYSYSQNIWHCKNGMCIDECNCIGTHLEDIVKHSKDITDLIEVGDVIEVYFPVRNTIRKIYVDEYFEDSMILNGIINGNVILKTILTKEMYESNCYTVERKEE